MWDWTLRVVLPMLELLLAAVVYDILDDGRPLRLFLEQLALALLGVAMLGILLWWIAACNTPPSGDVGATRDSLRRARHGRRWPKS